MRHKKARANYRRSVLRLPDLDHTKTAVLNSLTSPASRRVYQYAIDKFIAWYCSEPRGSRSIEYRCGPLPNSSGILLAGG